MFWRGSNQFYGKVIMLFAAITRKRILDKFQGMAVREFQDDDFFITLVWDDFYSKITFDDKFYQIFETSALSEKVPGDNTYLSFCYNRFDKNIILEKRQISGRPFYYYTGQNGDFYCSTHLDMLKKSGVPMQVNESVLPEFFMYRYVSPPQSLLKDVKLVFSGSVLEFSRQATEYHEKILSRYNPISTGATLKDAKDIDIVHVTQALDKPMRSLEPSTPVHFPLSGGLDSSILLKLIHQKRELSHTYSAGYPFENPDNNIEKEYALSAAKAFGTQHHYFDFSNKRYLEGVV